MKRTLLISVATLSVGLPATSHAQDLLGGFLRGAAENAARGLINQAVTAATSPNRPPASAAATATNTDQGHAARAPSGSAGGSTETALPADFPQPRPINYSPALRMPGELEFSQADRDAVRAFDAIGRYNCSDCEGGVGYDSWPRHEIPNMSSGSYALTNRLGGLAVGEALRWTGSQTGTRYAITVVGDRGIGPWPCKQLKWTGDRGELHVERMGLICKPTNNWHNPL